MISTFILLLLVHLTSTSEDSEFHNNTSVSEDPTAILEEVYGNILCRSCGNDVASSSELISKFSPIALHSFKDSIFDKDEVLVQVLLADFIFEYPVIITNASKCAGVDEWDERDSWFPGYRWRPCVCPDCGEYIGWVFESINPDIVETSTTFFALILPSLIGESCKYILISCQFSDCDSWRTN